MLPKHKTATALALMLMLLVTVPAIVSALLAIRSETTDMRQWLPDSGAERERYDWFVDKFGYDDCVLVSWNDCQLSDPRLASFRSALIESDDQEYLKKVVTPQEMLSRLTSPPFDLPAKQAYTRIKGILVGEQGAACAIVEVNERGIANPEAVLNAVNVAAEGCGIPADDLYLGGGVFEAVHIDRASMNSFVSCIGLSGLIGAAVAFLSLGSIRLTFLVIVVGAYNSVLSVALMYYLGLKLNAVLLVVPALMYVLVISNAVHLVSYYQHVVRKYGVANSATRTLGLGWSPCACASVTTAVGMLTLASSRIAHVRSFGISAAVGLIVGLAVLFAFFYAVLQLRLVEQTSPNPADATGASEGRRRGKWLELLLTRRRAILLISCVLLAFCTVGLSRTSTSVKLERMFRADDQLLINYRWLEAKVGPLAAYEVVLGFDNACELNILERLQVVQEVQRQVTQLPEVGGSLSAASFLPTVSDARSMRSTVQRAVFRKKFKAAIPALTDAGFLADSNTAQLWRVSARISALSDVDIDALGRKVDHIARSVIASKEQSASEISFRRAGTILVLHNSQHQILEDLTRSFCLAFVIICPLMIALQRNVWAGMLTMVPNSIPAIMVFGSMGWLGIPIDIGTILTASVALGIAVDDTLHFLTWFNRGLRNGESRIDAIRTAMKHCTVPMVQTTLICGLGLLAFAGSSFVPTSRFAILMFVLLISALVGDLVFLPALLASRLGRVFESRATGRTSAATRVSED